MFPICSFCRFWLFNIVVYQLLTNNQQVLKKKIMILIVAGACIFLIATAQVTEKMYAEFRQEVKAEAVAKLDFDF